MSNYQFKTLNIKGKDYVQVNERVLAFRKLTEYLGYSIESELISLDENSCVVKSIIKDASGRIISTGFAQEDKTSSMINRTSYVENCETSAVGRALGFLGVGIESSIATADEVSMAIAKQENQPAPSESASDLKDVFSQSVEYIKASQDKNKAFDAVIKKYESTFTKTQVTALKKFVR
jgi:hypothetical protein